jgi:hypothetical protein
MKVVVSPEEYVVVVIEVEAIASRPNITCGLAVAEDAFPRSGASDERRTTVQ